MTRFSRTAALALLALIVFATLSPIQMRPHIADANLERGLAYVLLGLAITIGFPKRVYQVAIFVICTAGVLEMLQIIDPGRHARFLDAFLKASAGIAGIVMGHVLARAANRAGLAKAQSDPASP
jgi:hypothetical protein